MSGLALTSAADLVIATGVAGTWWATVCVVVGQFVASFGVTLYIATNATLRQPSIPDAVRGRVFATFRLLNGTTIALGAMAAGLVVTLVELRETLVVTGAGELCVAGCLFAWRRLLPDKAADHWEQKP